MKNKEIWKLRRTLAIVLAFLLTMAQAGVVFAEDSSPSGAPQILRALPGEGEPLEEGNPPLGEHELNGSDHVLLIQSELPWDSNANTDVLDKLKEAGRIDDYYTVSVADAAKQDFSRFDTLIFANDQSSKSYDEYDTIRRSLEGYVFAGGTVLFGACDNGWKDSEIEAPLPLGIKKYKDYSYYNYIESYNNPVVTGELTDRKTLSDNMLYSNYCSHSCFKVETLPKDTEIIFRSSNTDDPTFVDCPYGKGHFVMSGLTWEYGYTHDAEYSLNAIDDYFLYGLSLSAIDDAKREGILNPLKIKSESSFYYADESKLYYKVFASITNPNTDASVIKPFATLNLDDNAEEETGGTLLAESDIKPGESRDISWVVGIDKKAYSDGGNYPYSITAGSNNTIALTQEFNIYIEATNYESNELSFPNDVWKFNNYSDSGCIFDKEDKRALTQGLPASSKSAMEEEIAGYEKNGSNGHCYGMSASVILNKMNVENFPEDFGKSNLGEIDKKDIEKRICFYHITQMLPKAREEVTNYMYKSVGEQLSLLADKASLVKSGGCPILFDFGVNGYDNNGSCVEGWAHALVAYALETGEFTGITGKIYDRRVLMYDCNAVKWNPDSCLLFNAGTDEWEIPNYCKDGNNPASSTNSRAYLKRCAYKLEGIDVQNRKTGAKNYKAELSCKRRTAAERLKIRINNWLIDLATGEVEGDDELKVYMDAAGSGEGDLHIVLPDVEDTYTLTTESGEPDSIDMNILYNNKYLAVKAESATGLTLDPSGKVSVEGSDGTIMLSLADDNAAEGELNTYRVTGKAKGAVSMELDSNEDKIKIEGDNIAGLELEASDGEYIKGKTIKENGSVSFDTDGKDLDVKRKIGDEDDNGNEGGEEKENTQTYTITASAGEGGKITPSGTVTVSEGNIQSFSITPDSEYKIYKVEVDGKDVGAVSTYTFNNVKEAHTIQVSFLGKDYAIETFENGEDKYTIIHQGSVRSNGKKHFQKGKGNDTSKKAYDYDVSILKNGTEVSNSEYKLTFKKNKKPGKGFFKIKFNGKSNKALNKAIKKNKYYFEIR